MREDILKVKSNMVYLALLRAVNVGGRKVEMAKLKQSFKNIGFTNVRTFIASGNVIFSTDRQNLTGKIESALDKDFGMEIKVLVVDQDKLKKIVQDIPDDWVNDVEMKCDVMFLWPEIDNKEILKQLPFDPKIEDVKYTPGAVIWRIDRDKVSKSKMFKLVGTKIHKSMTIRNPNTVRKIYQLMNER